MRCFLGIGSVPGGVGPLPGSGCWPQWWESGGLAWAAQASWNLDLVSDLARACGVVASGAASESREGAAGEALCCGALLLPVRPGQARLSTALPVEGSAHAAALCSSAAPRGTSSAQQATAASVVAKPLSLCP